MGKGEGVVALCGNWGGNFGERISQRERIERTLERAKIGDGVSSGRRRVSRRERL